MTQSEAPASLAARAFAAPSYRQALFQFGHTIALFGASIYLMFLLLPYSFLASLAIAPIAAAAYLRLFMIGHDCAHRSYLPKRWQNNLVGNVIGVLTNTPLHYWGSQHAIHHRTTGNLDRRGAGDVNTLTVEEYREASLPARVWYRIYRNPFMLMVVFAPIYFLFMLRLPLEQKKPSKAIWYSVIGTNIGIVFYYGTLIWLVGLVPFLAVYGPVVLLSSTGAVWLFYIQHQFEDAYWQRDDAWDYHDATLYGSSFYDLPRWAHWATGNIGYHHIHHLNPRVPNYRLAACYASDPAVQDAKKISFWESLKLGRLALWDEQARRMIRFRDLDRDSSAGAVGAS